jgi:hypothetical protein
MGLSQVEAMTRRFIELGRDPDTPAMSVSSGCTPQRRVVVSTLQHLAADVAAAELKSPVLTIVGEVVSLRDQMLGEQVEQPGGFRMSRAVPGCLNWSFRSREALDAAVKALIENPHVKELLPIRTCQRHELFALVLGDYLQSITEADSTCDGSDAATRLFAIAGGVLSDLPGERAVAEQVRNQLRLALKRRQAGSVLAKLARRALRSGEKLRDRVIETTPILELADLVTQFISGSSSRGLQPAGITLLGAGRVGKSLHAALQQRGLTIDCWATRHPRAVASGPNCSIEHALESTARAQHPHRRTR